MSRRLTRSWLILRVEGTHKILILKRSKKSRNPGQWDFIGGSSTKRRIDPRKLIRKETIEEIGFVLPYVTRRITVWAKFSIYHYFISTITLKQLKTIELSHEHSAYKIVNVNKLRHMKRLHHSIKIYLNH